MSALSLGELASQAGVDAEFVHSTARFATLEVTADLGIGQPYGLDPSVG